MQISSASVVETTRIWGLNELLRRFSKTSADDSIAQPQGVRREEVERDSREHERARERERGRTPERERERGEKRECIKPDLKIREEQTRGDRSDRH